MIDILIPTYNRAKSLEKNLNELARLIKSESPSSRILISDNSSTDETIKLVSEFIEANKEVDISIYQNDENIGLEENTIKILGKANANWIMFLGDDDYLPEGYIKYCVDQISSKPSLGCIIPAKGSILEDGSVETYNLGSNENYTPGVDTALSISHFASQMSGIILRNPKKLLKTYLESGHRSIYLFIYFTTYNLLHFDSIFAKKFLVSVTVNNSKDWSYNEIGLLDEIFKAYYPFKSSHGPTVVSRLIGRFLQMHAWRFGIVTSRPLQSISILRQILKTRDKSITGLKSIIIIKFLRTYFYLVRMKLFKTLKN